MSRLVILYIEDDDAQRAEFTGMLEGRGYDVRTCATAAEGLRVLEDDPPHAVLCDLNMPETDGIAFLERAAPMCPDIPIIILTAHGSIPLAVECIRKGASDFIRKPLEINEIEYSIQTALERQRLLDRTGELRLANEELEKKIRDRTREMEENAIALAKANVELLGAQELLEQKNRELKKAEERMLKLMEASPMPFVATRVEDGRILYANQHIADLVDMRAEDLVGRQAPDFYYDAAERASILEQLSREGSVRNREVLMKRADGTPFWTLFSVVVTKLGDDQVIVGGLLDIDERKRAEAALVESEKLFRGIVENANDVIFTIAPDGKVSYVSPNVRDLLGYAPNEIVGRTVEPFIYEDDLPAVRAFYERLGAKSSRPASIEYRVLNKEGAPLWYAINASAVTDEDGEPLFFVGIGHDVSERKEFVMKLERANLELKEAQTQLVQSEKMASLGMLVAGIAHEINTPIGAVGSMHDTTVRAFEKLTRAIELECPDKLDGHASLFKIIVDSNKVMRSGIERVTTIVKRLRSFARLDEAELKDTDINECIEDTLALVHHEIKHRVTVEKDFGALPLIACFPGRLNQVFLNLIVNAKQAIADTGTIRIETRLENHELVVRVSDNGSGIPADKLSKIFDPGFTTKGVGVGTGLGLSICYQIVYDHFGTISVESEVGEGTRFTVRIPDDLDTRYNEDGSLKPGFQRDGRIR